jgi:hypothetical protein
VDELRGGADQPRDGDRPLRRTLETGADTGWRRQVIEPRSRSEYLADLKQHAVTGIPERPFGERMDEPLDVARPGADSSHGSGDSLETPREVLKRFDPERAGLPRVSGSEGRGYIEANHADRPWLASVRDCSPETQRIFAALDQGGGHAHIRHEGWVTEEMNERRLTYLEDPAQTDPVKRAAGVDGLKPGGRPHRCGRITTRITDPDAFATAIARGVEHSDVRAALETPFSPGRRPSEVVLPISDLLGPDGYRYCTGWRLEAVDGSMKAAREQRDAWAEAWSRNTVADVPEPMTGPVDTFDGGTVTFAFGTGRSGNGYEIVTMYVRPPETDQLREMPGE